MSELVSPQPNAASEMVVERIAKHEDTDPAELSPLFDAIDPDALDAMVESATRRDTDVQIDFPYLGYVVRVTSNGTVDVTVDAQLY